MFLNTPPSVIGIDANCVPDPAIDTRRNAQSAYPNKGADVLKDAVTRLGLMDVVRELSGKDPHFTAHHIVAGGEECWTRIDQIYAPPTNNSHYEVSTLADIFPPRSQVEIDHVMIDLYLIHI